MSEFENHREVSEERPSSPTLSRRSFLRRAGKGLGAVALTSLISGSTGLENGIDRTRELRKTWETTFNTGELAGVDMPEQLFAQYFGIENGVMPEELTVNFPVQLIEMWTRKNERSHNNPEVQAVSNALLDEYCSREPSPSSVEQFTAEAEFALSDVLAHINWDAVRMLKTLSVEDMELVQRLVGKISGEYFTGLCMTELMPSKDGKVNRAALDLLLTQAGKEFIESVPALYDPLVSFGPYQFTAHALDAAGLEPVGASIINQALPISTRIPNTVAELRGSQHHTAAVLYVIENAGNLVTSLKHAKTSHVEPQLLERLGRVVQDTPEELMLFFASAHHAPGSAQATFEKWLDQLDVEQPRSYAELCSPRIATYTARMDRNIKALHAQ